MKSYKGRFDQMQKWRWRSRDCSKQVRATMTSNALSDLSVKKPIRYSESGCQSLLNTARRVDLH
ncbi:hypothetical protein BDR05DRAFT_703103 [Suillus weaverae]|nr:hypothetical protein BDR05DRAFT_703103 [Suillus weaverae]